MDQMAALRAFVRVVEAGNFTRAAASLAMPKATLTKLVQGLEAHVRTHLLARTTRRVTVTPDGAAYYERVVRLLTELDELDSTMSSQQAKPSGRLRIDTSALVAVHILIPALPNFHARYPDIQVDLGVTDRAVDLVGENVDCVLRAGDIVDQSLIARRIGQLAFVTCAAPGYLTRYGEPRHPRELEGDHFTVSYFSARTGRNVPLEFVRDGEHIEIYGRHRVATNDGNAFVAAAVHGYGIAQAPAFMAERLIETGELMPVLSDWSADGVPIHVVYPPNRHLSNKLRVFVDWAADLFAVDAPSSR
ncbi:LysR family transcriptional regulator [Chelatococcus reniformis]|uniref:LysR family transcriptional regulator n=1 Tax=Chelatococcus reniformis TaxID=1494448 RepID=A0A916U4E3_9HYPH|nr:LysR family transcriptional regulator [Chelatococcus reniformis]GGC58920.1 LysR family transcriptional regulator [Chelatococcus reniformis]